MTDVYINVNEANDDTLEKIITRLEFRDTDPTFSGWINDYLDKLPLMLAVVRVLLLEELHNIMNSPVRLLVQILVPILLKLQKRSPPRKFLS